MPCQQLQPRQNAGAVVCRQGGDRAVAGQVRGVQTKPGHQEPTGAQRRGQGSHRAIKSALCKERDDVSGGDAEVEPARDAVLVQVEGGQVRQHPARTGAGDLMCRCHGCCHGQHGLIGVDPHAVVTEVLQPNCHPAGAAPGIQHPGRRWPKGRAERGLAVHVLAGCRQGLEPGRILGPAGPSGQFGPAGPRCLLAHMVSVGERRAQVVAPPIRPRASSHRCWRLWLSATSGTCSCRRSRRVPSPSDVS